MEGEGIISLSSSSYSKRSFDIISVLIVDDDTTSLAIVAGMLKQFKYNVVTVKNPKDALCTLRTKNGLFDLVVTDLHMPDMNGMDLLRVISEEFDLPVILMSADDNDCIVLQGLENGAVFFISKPVCPEDLRDLWQFAAMNQKGRAVGEQTSEARNTNDIVASSSSSSLSASDDENHNNNNEKRKGSRHQESGEDNSQSASNKKPKIVWNNALHSRFLDAIRSIGLERAVPKKILEVMDVPGLTRENVASHLQKYRIFLRRVSNASFNINNHSRNKIFRYFASSDLTVPQPSFVPNTQNPNPDVGNPTSSLNTFPQSSFNQPTVLNSNCPIVPNSMTGSSSTVVMVSGASCGANVSQNFAPYRSNYVGFSISGIKQLTEFGQSSGSKASVGDVGNGNENHENNGAGLVGPGEDIIGSHRFCGVNGPSPALDPLLGCDENGFGRFDDLSLSPMIDLSDLCHLLNGPLDLAEANNQQTHSGFGNTVMSSGFHVGSSSNYWMNNEVPNLDQAANQQHHVGAMSSLYQSSAQVNQIMLPLVNEPQQALEVVANNNINDQNMANANLNHNDQNMDNANLDHNDQNMANVNLIDQNMGNNDFENDHEGFMETIFASFRCDNQTLDRI